MQLVCLDFDSVLIPEIFIALSEATGIPEFRLTTREEPDYDKIMRLRLDLLRKHNLKLADVQRVIAGMNPFDGAAESVQKLRGRCQVIILSDTFKEFANPLLAKLGYPTILCNSLEVDAEGNVTGYRLRQRNGKKLAVVAFHGLNVKVFASGDSFNDLGMIAEADAGCLFGAPQNIRESYPAIRCVDTYDELLAQIDQFLAGQGAAGGQETSAAEDAAKAAVSSAPACPELAAARLP